MPSTTLQSTSIRHVAFDPQDGTMHLTFQSGRTYTFANVPQDIYDALVNADSPGRYYNQMIRGNFPA